MMKKLISTACFASLAVGPAFAANSINISICSARYVAFTWNVDDLAATGIIKARDTGNSANSFIIPLPEASGNYSGDVAGAWSGSNLDIEIFLADDTSVSATCPSN